MLFSGGSSLLAKGAQIGGAGVVTAAKGAAALERLSAKGLQKIVGDKIKKKIAKDVLIKGVSKGAGSAVEGALYGTGQLISENALGNKEFNAENVLAAGKEGALWGGLIGAGFGAAPSLFKGAVEVTVPRIKGNRIVGWASKKIDKWKPEYSDQDFAAWSVSGIKYPKYLDLKNIRPEVIKNARPIIREAAEDQGIGVLSSNKKLYSGLKTFQQKVQKKIKNIIDSIDEVNPEAFSTRGQMIQKLDEAFGEIQEKYYMTAGKVNEGFEKKFQEIQATRDKFLQKIKKLEKFLL